MNASRSKSHLYFLLVAGLLVILASCANPVSPTGGPKDTTPPEIMKSVPENQSVNFSSDQVVFTFSEFVKLDDINAQMVISPPMAELPDFTLRGKTLTMKFKEPLRENTTYNFFFGDGIVDITESNPLSNFSFSLATGPVIDSLYLDGVLLNAFNNEPVAKAYVMLYDSIYDSVPFLTRPYYLARTNEKGEFVLSNLRDGQYLMFTLSDINGNYIYDPPSEAIGFADSLIRPSLPVIPVFPLSDAHDSLHLHDSLSASSETDSLKLVTDSLHITIDSITKKMGKSCTLFQFSEADSIQRLLKGQVVRENVLSFAFRYPVKNPEFRPIGSGFTGSWYFVGNNLLRDTLTLWIPHPGADSLTVEVLDEGRVLDTLYLALKPARPNASARKPVLEAPTPRFTFKNNLVSLKIKPNRPLILTFPDPVGSYIAEKLEFLQDSIPIKPSLAFSDSLQTSLFIRHPWAEGHTYKLIIHDSAFVNIFGHANDSTAIVFSAIKEAESGSIKMAFKVPRQNTRYIVQLLGDKEKLMEQYSINNDTTLNFSYLIPKTYTIKVIFDNNRNGRWDTGNYLKKIQPEKVDYFTKPLELRANWSIEEEWVISEPLK